MRNFERPSRIHACKTEATLKTIESAYQSVESWTWRCMLLDLSCCIRISICIATGRIKDLWHTT